MVVTLEDDVIPSTGLATSLQIWERVHGSSSIITQAITRSQCMCDISVSASVLNGCMQKVTALPRSSVH